MYKFRYDYIESIYCKKSRLLFAGTDSLMYETKTKDVYKDFIKDKKIFGFSTYSTKSKYDKSKKLVVGKIKSETAGIPTEAFVGLNPKIYSLLVDDNSEHKIGTHEINKISNHALVIKHISKTMDMMD